MDPPDENNTCLVIVNPNAGRRKGEKDWHQIARYLGDAFDFQQVFTERRLHAIELVQKHIAKGIRKIIVVGGDGTLNEVVNGIFRQKTVSPSQITLGAILVGTGNDWGRMFGIPFDYEEAIHILKQNQVFYQDAGIVRYHHENQKLERYFLNIAGLGFDAVVVNKANLQKERGKTGKILYFLNIFTNLWKYKYIHTHLSIDGTELQDDVFTMSIGIGKYSGGGMKQTPHSIPNDGLFDLTVIKKMSRFQIIKSLPLLYNGEILKHPKVQSFRGKKIRINSSPEIHVEVDGESLGHSPIEIEIIPKSIRIIAGHHPY
jgi:YegS/Rv2252/BmrU family lipid kinase